MPRTKTDYSKTLIYKLASKNIEYKEIYIGHTTDFINRKSKHKGECNNPNSKCYNTKVYQTIRANGGWSEWVMIELEKYPCKDGNEARAREQYFYDLHQSSLNSINPYRTKEQIKEYHTQYKTENREQIKDYYKQHKEHFKNYYQQNKEQIKTYYKENKEQIKEKTIQKINCICGSIFERGNKSKHFKTDKHIKYITENPPAHTI